MCGIVGAVASRNVVSTLIEGLSRLEYRGYDSAGVAVLSGNKIERVRAVGRVAAMTEKANEAKLNRPSWHRPYALGHAWRRY